MSSNLSEDHKTKKIPIFENRSLQVEILISMIGMLVITVMVTIWYTYHQNTKLLLEVSDDLISQVRETIMEKTMNYLQPASMMVEIGSHIAGHGVVALTDKEEIEKYATDVLKAYPQLAMFNIGDEHGNFIMPKKLPDKTFATKIIDRTGPVPGVTWKYRDQTGAVVRTENSPVIDYDPRVRPWYIGAKNTGKTFWTDMYILFTDRKPGITAGHPVYGQDGRLYGVFSIDIELGAMSTFLKTLKVGRSGIVFIINSKNEVVAFPDESLLVKKENDKLRPVRVEELGIERIEASFREHVRTGAEKFVHTSGGKRHICSYTSFPKSFGKDWKIVVIVPEDDFIGGIKRTNMITMFISLFILLIAVISAIFLARRISKPITLLTEETKKIKELKLDDAIPVQSSIKEIRLMSDAISGLRIGLQSFRKYVPAELVRQLIRTGEEARLGGQQRQLTVFFSDAAGFGDISEKLSPDKLMRHLSEYLDELTRIIMEHQGTVDKYIGDAIMGFWGAPVADENHAYHACKAAFHCQKKLRELNARWEKEGNIPLPTRIGISTGDTVVGNMGSDERMNYTVIGDTVNLASRLEGMNKLYHSDIIVSQETYQKIDDKLLFRPIDVISVKGKAHGIRIYELLGTENDELISDAKLLCDEFGKAFESYLQQDWDNAIQMFFRIMGKFPDDKAAKLYYNRCKKFKGNPPGQRWDGIIHHHS